MNSKPLADRMRPQKLDDIVGQDHLVGKTMVLRQLIETDSIPSMILWGPPGIGKTTLARIIANETKSHFIPLSATDSGVKDIQRIVDEAKLRTQNVNTLFNPQEQSTDPKHSSTRTILFVDEIHRFNKAQQDRLLPHVESGVITLIGATTENPSFEVISPLLSRSRVFVLKELTPEDISHIIDKALINLQKDGVNASISNEDKAKLSRIANGDARSALNILELSIELGLIEVIDDSSITITSDLIEKAVQTEYLRYDQTGEEHYNTISAFIKSMRASDGNGALYYLARMVEAGEDPKFIARRMVIFASEDIGLANPTALVVANAVFRACETVGYPECSINLAHGVAYLAQCPKDRSANDALIKARQVVKEHGNLPIPMNLRNAPTKLMQELGYGKNYEKYPQNTSLLPEEIAHHKYLIKKEPGNDTSSPGS